MAPMTINSSTTAGEVTDEELAYYLVRSSSPGAVITAGADISSEGQAFNNGMSVDKDRFIPGLKKLASVIKMQWAKASLEIYHAGRIARSEPNSGRIPGASSAVKAGRPWAGFPRQLGMT